MQEKSHTLLTLGTSSCNALILSAILSLRNCNENVNMEDKMSYAVWICSIQAKIS